MDDGTNLSRVWRHTDADPQPRKAIMTRSLLTLTGAAFIVLAASTAKAQSIPGCFIWGSSEVLCGNCEPTSCGSCVLVSPGVRRCELAGQQVTQRRICETWKPPYSSQYGSTAQTAYKRCYKLYWCDGDTVNPCDGLTACATGYFAGYDGAEIEIMEQGPGCPIE